MKLSCSIPTMLLAPCLLACTSPLSTRQTTSKENAEALMLGAADSHFDGVDWPVCRFEGFEQRVRANSDLSPEPLESIFVWNREVNPVTGEEYSTEMEFTASFAVLAVVARCANDFLLLGRDLRGDYLLERWRIDAVTGGFDAPRAISTSGLLVAAPLVQPALPLIVGGTFVPPMQRNVRPTARRANIWRAPHGQVITTCAIDPDGRFALFSDGSAIWQIDLSGFGSPALVPGTDALPLGTV